MGKVIIYTNENGNVSVCYPSGEMALSEMLIRDCPEGAIIVEESSLPYQDNDFFNAWELKDETITINLNKAKEITKDRLRFEREPLLAAQDVLVQIADETGADKTSIYAEKQRLRDITNLADSATTTEELRSIKL